MTGADGAHARRLSGDDATVHSEWSLGEHPIDDLAWPVTGST
jgi:hypothetical protein